MTGADLSMTVESRARAESPLRTFGLGMCANALVPPQPAGWSFFVWARSGSVTVRTARRAALACGLQAVWVPEGTAFGVDARGACDLRVAYVARGAVMVRAFSAVGLTPVLREILERAVSAGYLNPGIAREARLIDVAIDELQAMDAAPPAFELSLPANPRLREAIQYALRDPASVPSVAELVRLAGMSPRTFERHFATETGVTPRTWLRRARLHAASAALAAGATTTDAGLAAGYSSLSAFIAAYRYEFGMSPGLARMK